jgi:hypothetical protein
MTGRDRRAAHALSALTFVCAAVMALSAEDARAEPKAVVELFTSQGCSSCPAADKLLAELSRDPSIVALSVPIDYWDYLGWKDTLAKPKHSIRQRGYAQTRGDREIYTPQVVVNGAVQVLGSDRNAIEEAIQRLRKQGSTAVLPVTITSNNEQLQITVAASHEPNSAGEVWLCALAKTVSVKIGRGENKGRTVDYHNVARRWVKLGQWSGATKTWMVPVNQFEDDGSNALAVLVQSGTLEKPGPIIGAAFASLR